MHACALQFGKTSGNYTTTVPVSQTATYPQASICGGFEATYTYIDPGLFNSANLTGLTPATKYYYRVGALVSPCPLCTQGQHNLISKICLSAGGTCRCPTLAEGDLSANHAVVCQFLS